jgi:hypothetical protein
MTQHLHDIDALTSNYALFLKMCSKLGERSEAVTKMVEHMDERLLMAPASTKLSFHCAHPGGLVEHSLNVLRNLKKLIQLYDADISSESMIMVSLFHDWGKVGDLDEAYYLEQDSDWHREKLGQMYKINEDIQSMPNAERGLWLMQHFGVQLTLDEWIAIRTNDGQGVDENKPYFGREPTLALLLQHADQMATKKEKEKYS